MFKRFLQHISLKNEIESVEAIQSEIEKGVVFKGTNFWVLCFAIVVASVGLNTNSTAVIIGAMLISPMMGPINAIGFSVATYNFTLFRRALRNLIFAIFTALLASTFYFAVTPVSTAHSELLARIHPTIYDVLIALFGGFAGIVGITSKIKGNVLPGVAIATALIPPLCTAGYGLATGQINFFFGALYLFLINAVFIALANLIVVRYLNLPINPGIDTAAKYRTKYVVYSVMLLTIIPSIYFGFQLVKQEQFKEYAEKYCIAVKKVNDKFLLEHAIDIEKRKITLVYGGDRMTEKEKKQIQQKSHLFHLTDAKVEVTQGITLGMNQSVVTELDQLKLLNLKLQQANQTANYRLDSLAQVTDFGKQLLHEIAPLEKQVVSLSFTTGKKFKYTDEEPENSPIVLVGLARKISVDKEIQLKKWLAARINLGELHVLFYVP